MCLIFNSFSIVTQSYRIMTSSGTQIPEKGTIDEGKEESLSWSSWIRTSFAASTALMVVVFIGLTEAQSAIMLPELRKNDSYIHVTPDQETWIASLGILFFPIGALLIGSALDTFGRKKGLLFFYLSMGVGFVVIACATELYQLYIGRSICAFAVGLEVVAVVYLAEISTKRQRSCYYSLFSVGHSAGVILTPVFGFLPWNIASALFALGSFICFVVQCFSPESPAWLYKTGQLDACTKSLQTLGRSPSSILRELQLLKMASKEENTKFQLGAFFQPAAVWKPFLILSLFLCIQSGTGTFDILCYTVDFSKALGTSYDPLSIISSLISVVRFISSATFGVFFVSSISRKYATAISSLWMAITLGGTGVYEYVYREETGKPYEWLPVALVVCSVAASSFANTNLPWIMSGELFPLQVRGTMTGACFLVGTLCMFTTIKLYVFCVETLQFWGLLWMFAGFSVVGLFFGLYVLPETQDKTLYEIEQGFLPKNERRLALVQLPEKR